MKQAKGTAFVATDKGPLKIRKDTLWEDTDPLVKSHPSLFKDVEAETKVRPPKVFTAESPENAPSRPVNTGKGTQAPVAPERKKPGPKPGAKRAYPKAREETPDGGK